MLKENNTAWQTIECMQDMQEFMEVVGNFHDSCIKEIKYSSGAYVHEGYRMHAINDKRVLDMILQFQHHNVPALVLEFIGLKELCLRPNNDKYTSEILEASMFFYGGLIYWCDDAVESVSEISTFTGTVVCAQRCRWRIIPNCFGQDDFFVEAEES